MSQSYLSQESDFYGDDALKRELESRTQDLDVADWWANHPPSLTAMAYANVEAEKKRQEEQEQIVLSNPYEGKWCGRQLNESVEEFLRRLPPSTTAQTDITPWIFIANPFLKATKHKLSRDDAPTHDESNWPECTRRCFDLLQEFTMLKAEIEKTNRDRPQATVTRMVNKVKEEYVQKILDTAKELHCTSGKWMLFPNVPDVDAMWRITAKATARNDLGSAAKVAPDGGDDRSPRLICIYTEDFSDKEDVHRVLQTMRELGLFKAQGRPIYYKCDIYTYLDLKSGNQWGIKPSLYSSTEILSSKGATGAVTDELEKSKPKRTEKKLDSYFQKKQRVE